MISHLSSEGERAADGETESSTQSRDAKAAGGAVEVVRAVCRSAVAVAVAVAAC